MRLSLARGFARFKTVRGWQRRQKIVRKNIARMLSANEPAEALIRVLKVLTDQLMVIRYPVLNGDSGILCSS